MANNMNVVIRANGRKECIPTQNDIILEDLIGQLIIRDKIPNGNYTVTRQGMNDSLNQARSLEELAISDGDVLDLSSVGEGG